MALGETCRFEQVFAGEVNSINKRRKRLREQGEVDRRDIELEPEPLETSDGSKPRRPTENSDVVGLALSGGAFAPLPSASAPCRLYTKQRSSLSTVSGGYIGSSLSAGMTATEGHFPFESGLSEDETPSLQHIRDHSNEWLDVVCRRDDFVCDPRGILRKFLHETTLDQLFSEEQIEAYRALGFHAGILRQDVPLKIRTRPVLAARARDLCRLAAAKKVRSPSFGPSRM